MSQSTSPRIPRPLLLAGLLFVGGCFDDCGSDDPYDPQPGPGELGRGEFHYRCIGDGDPACSDDSTVGNFPARVAVGGRFQLDYTWNDDDVSQAPPDLRSGAPERLRVAGEIFTPLTAGYTAVLAVLPDSAIGDLIHIHATTPATLAIQHERVDYSAYTIAAGDELRFDAITRDTDAYVLAGLLEFTLVVDDPSVADVVGTGSNHVILRGLNEGSTTLRATLGDLSAELVVSVEGSFEPWTSTTDETATGSTETTETTETTTETTGDDSTTSTDSSGTTETTGGAL